MNLLLRIGLLFSVFLTSGCQNISTCGPSSRFAQCNINFVEEKSSLPPTDFEDSLHMLMQSAAEQRDADLLALIAPDITISYGVKNGRAAFVEMWKDPDAAEPWGRFLDTMEDALSDGAFVSANSRMLKFPHHAHTLRRDADIYFLGRVSKKALIRTSPDAEAAPIERDGYHTVLCTMPRCSAKAGQSWVKVTTPNGTHAVVAEEEITPASDFYRAIFERDKDGWKLVLFVKGD